MKIGSPFYRIYDDIARSKDLTPRAKILHAVLLSYPSTKKTGKCSPTNRTLASVLHCTELTITRQLAELQRHRLIRIRLNGKRQLYVRDARDEEQRDGMIFRPVLPELLQTVPPRAVLLHAVLMSKSKFRKGDGYRGKNQWLADEAGMAVQDVQRALVALRGAGILADLGTKNEGRGGRMKHGLCPIIIDWMALSKMTGSIEKENREDNSTSKDVQATHFVGFAHSRESDTSQLKEIQNMPRTTPLKPVRAKARPVVAAKQQAVSDRKSSLLEYWNGLPGLHKKQLRSDTKIYQETAQMLRRLGQVSFSSLFSLDPDWADGQRLTDVKQSRILIQDEIKQGLKHLSEAMGPASSLKPQVLAYLRKTSLKDLIFNPNTRKSMFLAYLYNPIKPVCRVTARALSSVEPDERDIVNMLIAVIEKNRKSIEPRALEKALLCLEKIRAWRAMCSSTAVKVLPSSLGLMTRYVDWLDDWSPSYLPRTLDHTGPGSSSWSKFCESILDEDFEDAGGRLDPRLPKDWVPKKYTREDELNDRKRIQEAKDRQWRADREQEEIIRKREEEHFLKYEILDTDINWKH